MSTNLPPVQAQNPNSTIPPINLERIEDPKNPFFKTSLKAYMNDLLKQYLQSIQKLFKLINGTIEGKTNSLPNIPEALNDLLEVNEKLNSALPYLINHRRIQAHLDAIDHELVKEERAVFKMIEQLQVAKANLYQLISKAEGKQSEIEKDRVVDIPTVLSYAQRISATTSAPPNFDNQSRNIPAEPPYPGEVVMRSGLLAHPDLIQPLRSKLDRDGEAVDMLNLDQSEVKVDDDEQFIHKDDADRVYSHFGTDHSAPRDSEKVKALFDEFDFSGSDE
ncbi:hypothetical protein CONCODRAFT_78182 [Conidiobolus coronatus NRRL 28638]|uniref:Mediator of RNA polymerase II transcription subunit 4 n=1 Tax=Conidiobolus coronatus (strain ATCC 28846 / CBS 209.66 / NRRL 28638) TaxID=796925 RepID=A0A137P9S4_CONC2|nr:hypothetical protein CONCODRAFT_78182 [Conidiobolus coronatus NRRL 28638]|eukprot:KXN71750.1 hypothetical protein CONCODRAFT_78182 [Conidiobolus coronatus NRRL 28638]